ncbi:uncharacterized protein BDZ83DRAFT_638801 [Colletotrichum acutatum]|uniref:BTB domain-containing protein n=1 Tax=Glomerella acutata TaxID=27357 RepID=A0AAD8UCQ0_GLOAC|nr:uncharacterized protein BDZ83DRAFT_638801 [Colletotrichum acutatum]KAK1712236.1 hypothetical protein BDZ83DRAFT_638801 [Colletotrichum acutatum]
MGKKVKRMAESKTLLKEIAELFNKSDHADVKIRIGEFELPAHGLVLAAHSPYFKNALKGNFQESESKTFEFREGSAHAERSDCFTPSCKLCGHEATESLSSGFHQR